MEKLSDNEVLELVHSDPAAAAQNRYIVHRVNTSRDIGDRNQYKAWVYLAPALILLLIFSFYPLINTFRMALLNGYTSDGFTTAYQVGFRNFKTVVNFVDFKQCLKNTVLLCVITVPISTTLALLIAVALNSIKPLQRMFQTIFFLPYVTNAIAIGMVFKVVFNRVAVGDLVQTEAVINRFIGGFKEYSSIVGIFGETMGPAGSEGQMNTIVGFVYKMLPYWKTGVASAASLILFGIILIVTAINGLVSKRTVHY